MTKMQRGDDEKSGVTRSSALSDDITGANPAPLSHLEYPLVKYWEKKVWKNIAGTRKDTSEVETKGGTCGGTRSSRGENIMMLYIEDTMGHPLMVTLQVICESLQGLSGEAYTSEGSPLKHGDKP